MLYGKWRDSKDVSSESRAKLAVRQRKTFGWIFDQFAGLTALFHKTDSSENYSHGELYLRAQTVLKMKIDGKICLLWCIFAHLHPALAKSYTVTQKVDFFFERLRW